MKNGFKSTLKRRLLPAAALSILFFMAVIVAGGCSAGGTVRIDFSSKQEAGKGPSLKGRRVMLVKAQVASELRKSLPWWDESWFNRIAAELSKEKPGERNLSISDPAERQRFTGQISRLSDRKDDLLVFSCVGDSSMQSRLSLPEWCDYWTACCRGESGILKRQSDESSSLDNLLKGRAETLRLLSKRYESLESLSRELDDRDAVNEYRKSADGCAREALAAEIKAEKFRKMAAEAREALKISTDMCGSFEKAREKVNAGASIDGFLKTADLDQITGDFLKKLEASGSIKTVSDIAPWLESTINRIQEPFRANCEAEATIDDKNTCSFHDVHRGDYYVIVPSVRLGKRDYFMCGRISWKGGARHNADYISICSMSDWGLLRRLFSPYAEDIIKKSAIGSITQQQLSAFLESRPSAVGDKDGRGMTALHYAAQKGDFLTVNTLLGNGADANALNLKNESPLLCAVICASGHGSDNNYIQIINTLLNVKALINSGDGRKMTALHHAVAGRCSTELMKLLIDRGADVNAADEEGNTPLHFAARNGYPDVIGMLTVRGADILRQNKEGETPVDTARLFSHPLAAAVMKEKVGERDMNLKARELFIAIDRNDPAKVRELVTGGKALVNAKEASGEGRTPLHLAVEKGNAEIVEYLISQGAKVNAKDLRGRTPLSRAREGKMSEIEGILTKHGAR